MKKRILAIILCLAMVFTTFGYVGVENSAVQTVAATEQAELSLYDQLMAADSIADINAIISNSNENDCNALTDEEIDAVLDHIDALDPQGEAAETESLVDMLIALPNFVSGAEKDGEEAEEFDTNYIYFDLYYGDVTFKSSEYTGYDRNGKPVKGAHVKENKYYIYQSNGATTEWENGIPKYNRLMVGDKTWGEYITNNTDVLGVIEKWKEVAGAAGRSETPSASKLNDNVVKNNPDVNVQMHHRIQILGAESVTTNYDITIDNVWSGFQNDDCRDASGNFYQGIFIMDGPHYRKSGGLTFRPMNETTTATIRLKGDNRFGNVHYDVGQGVGGIAKDQSKESIDNRIEQLYFCNADVASNPGTITVANLRGDTGENHFCSVIGGANNPNYVPGLVFESGTVYAGATELDNCTAIGGGGCGFGGVTIKGGTVTAVTATNGTAIGGGIGDGSNGGAADVYISGGTVYAYNKGLAIEGTRESNGGNENSAGYNPKDKDNIYVVMPAVAIGSGSSRREFTVPAKVEIVGGNVYAESVGGTAVGGGSSNNYNAANAYVTISGGTVTAKSVPGEVRAIHEYDSGKYPQYVTATGTVGSRDNVKFESVSASTSIGGGTAGVPFRYQKTDANDKVITAANQVIRDQSNGGNAILSVSGNARIYAGSIGGGGVNALPNASENPLYSPVKAGKIGSAQVTISGGIIQGQVIMAKGAEMDCFLEMTGGTIDNSTKDDSFVFLKENGGAAYVENGSATISGGTIVNCDDAVDGGVFYVVGGDVIMNGGTIGGTDAEGNSLGNIANRGGAIFVKGGNVVMSGGSILKNTAKYGGAIYAEGGNVTIHHGIINENTAFDGGAVYLAGDANTILKMESGQMNNNHATGELDSNGERIEGTGDGGAIYATNGQLFIGLNNCTGPEKDESGNVVDVNNTLHNQSGTTDRHHPQLTGNRAEDCGGGITVANEGNVHFYCGDAKSNSALYQGVGHNVFMMGGNFYLYAGAEIGQPRNPDLVLIGGELHNQNALKDPVKLMYWANNLVPGVDNYFGFAELDSFINLPDGEYFFEKPTGKSFFGWTEKGPNSEDNDRFVRNKDQYQPSGQAIQVIEAGILHLYALWAPETSTITYVDGMTYQEITNTPATYNFRKDSNIIDIPEAEKPGYEVEGWYIYQDEGQNANWGYEPAWVDGITEPEQKTYDNLDYDKLTYLPTDENGVLHLEAGNMNFGNITLIAKYKPALGDLHITKKFPEGADYSIDGAQSFVFHIYGNPDRAGLDDFEMTVVLNGEGTKIIDDLPVGVYRIVEVQNTSWRYTANEADQTVRVNGPKADETGCVSFTNTRVNDKWLNGNAFAQNIFGKAKQ